MSLKFLRDQRAVEIGGKSYDLTNKDQVALAKEALRSSNVRRDAVDVGSAVIMLDEMRGHIDVLGQLALDIGASLVEADVEAEEAMAPEQLDAMMEEYADCVTRARLLHPKLDHKGKTVEAIQREALAARGHKTDGQTADYVRGAFNNATEAAGSTFKPADLGAMGAGAAGNGVQNTKVSALSSAYKRRGAEGRAS